VTATNRKLAGLSSLCLLVAAGQGILTTAYGQSVEAQSVEAQSGEAQSGEAQSVETISAEGLHALVNDNKGKVVVVNFWASWCPPCLREFPDIIKVYDEYHAEGLEVVAVTINEADETQDIAEFLERFEPPFAIYRATSIDETFFEGVVDTWFGEIPMTLIFDTSGNTAHFYRKTLTHEELASDVSALLPSS